MARPIKWRDRVYELRERVKNSRIETWTRPDLQNLFDVSRASAQSLMKAIGDVQQLGPIHVVSRSSLLSYLESLIAADDLTKMHRDRLVQSAPVPRPRRIEVQLPDDLRTVMVRDLPHDSFTLQPGRLEIRGCSAIQIVERLVLLAQALQNDLDSAASLLDPPRPARPQDDADLKALFVSLREKEAGSVRA